MRVSLPLDLGRHSQPEPDFAILPGHARDAMPHPRIASLVIEISDATLRKDRVIKAHTYAQAGIADYWIVNLNDRQVEVHRDPGPNPGRKGRFLYRSVTIIPADGHVSPLAKPESRIAVAEMLP
jgi:Uma2 family endonuclease